MRPTTSDALPGANGTTSVTARLGQSCACADGVKDVARDMAVRAKAATATFGKQDQNFIMSTFSCNDTEDIAVFSK